MHDQSVEALRLESERNRRALTSTVSELRQTVSDTAAEIKTRISPAHIKEELQDYVRESKENFVHSLERKARENPLQAVAVGAAIAYPLLGVVRAIPIPVMLIGAGLWFAGKHGKTVKAEAEKAFDAASQRISGFADYAHAATHDGAQHVSDMAGGASRAVSSSAGSVADRARAAVHDVRDSLAGMGGAAAGSVSDAASAASDLASRASAAGRERLGQAGDALSSGVSAAADKARDAAHGMRDTISGVSDSLASSVSDAAAAATDMASRTAMAVRDRAVSAGEQSRTMFVDMVDRNPLLAVGVGLTIGAVLAASFPVSNAENQLFGETSDGLKEKARDAASDGIERARDVAKDAIAEAASAASREGLNPQTIQSAVGGLAQSVKAVAERGVQTALGDAPSPKSSTQPPKGGNGDRI